MSPDTYPGAGNEDQLDARKLREETDRMIESLTDPRYLEAVRAVREAPDDARLAEATRRLSPAGLRDAGVAIPPGMRLSSRYFEPGLPSEIELGDVPEADPNLINTLNEAAPGLLDRLRAGEPELFERLVASDRKTLPDGFEPAGLIHCACGGAGLPIPFHPIVCSGVGVDTGPI